MKRFFNIIISAILLGVVPVSCNFLDEKNYSELNTDEFFKDSVNVVYAVNGCYDALQNLASNLLTCTEVPSDYVCISLSSKNASEANWHNGIFSYNDAAPQNLWQNLYKLIYNCNLLIDNVHLAPLTDVYRDRYIAEARCLRGWAYLVLVNLFGDVPYRNTSVFGETFDCPLSSKDDIYGHIIEDFEFAESNLFDFSFGRTLQDSKGAYNDETERMRASKDAAMGLLAMTYMYRAQNDESSPYWQLARDKAKELIDRCGGIESALSSGWLSASYESLYRGEGKYGQENLLAIYFDNSGKSEGSNLANQWAVFNNYSKAQNAGYRRFTQKWYNDHFAGHYDLRNSEGMMHEIVNNKGAKFIFPDNGNNDFLTDIGRNPESGYSNPLGKNAYGPWLSKYNDENAVTSGGCETGIILLRYAEVLLIFAEAENEVNGPTADAYAALNAVRQRAQLVDMAPDGMDKDQFREFVLDERERELFGEAKRLFDLNRRHMYGRKVSATQYDAGSTEISGPYSTLPYFEYDGYARIRDYEVLHFAIPKNEMDANGAL